MIAEKPQHLAALDRANIVRLGKARLKEQINRGDMSAVDALWDNTFPNMPIGELLRAQSRWAYTRMRKVCALAGISEHKRIGTLTERQRDLLTAILEDK